MNWILCHPSVAGKYRAVSGFSTTPALSVGAGAICFWDRGHDRIDYMVELYIPDADEGCHNPIRRPHNFRAASTSSHGGAS